MKTSFMRSILSSMQIH